jgi:peptide/nickel transport system permease protein
MSSLSQLFFHKYRQKASFRRSLKFLMVVFVIALLAPFLANDQPLIVYDAGGFHFPALSTSMNQANFDNAILRINAPISYSPGVSDFDNSGYVGPFDKQLSTNINGNQVNKDVFDRHWLGTTLRGCDVFAGLIHGAGISLYVGIFAALLSGFLGIFLGGFSAIYKVQGKKISVVSSILIILWLLMIVNISFNVNAALWLKISILLIVSFAFYFLSKFINKKNILKLYFSIPIDFIESQLNVMFSSFPKTLIIIAVSGFIIPGWTSLVFLLAITGWMEISRTSRAEFLRIMSLDYIDAAKMSGAGFLKVLFKHLLPNALPAIITVFVFNVALCMLTEASLSFLGIGVPADSVTWGTLLAEGRDYYKAWWLVVFPGFMITTTIYCLLTVGEAFRDGKID